MFGMLKTSLGLHRWCYRNPSDRTCGVCGRREVEHIWWTDPPVNAGWEVFDEGVAAPCNRHSAEGDDQ